MKNTSWLMRLTALFGCAILLAGLAPTVETGPRNLSDVRYLRALYDLGAAPYFDVVVGKPYGFDTSPDDGRVDESALRPLQQSLERSG